MSLYRILLTAAASAAFLAAQNSPSQQPNRRGENPYSQSQNSSNQSQDHAFLQKADQANQAEIMMGKLAEQKASNSSVKSYAERIVNDHGGTIDVRTAPGQGTTFTLRLPLKREA